MKIGGDELELPEGKRVEGCPVRKVYKQLVACKIARFIQLSYKLIIYRSKETNLHKSKGDNAFLPLQDFAENIMSGVMR
jgi:hypothetical protein